LLAADAKLTLGAMSAQLASLNGEREEEERRDELGALPAPSCGGPDRAAAAPDFSRLDPNRRSLSTPAVNWPAGAQAKGCARAPPGGQQQQRQRQQQQQQQAGRTKLRRRTSLGLISHFRLGSSSNPNSSSGPRPANWRNWLLGGDAGAAKTGANSARKFLLRNLKPQLAQMGK